MNLSLASLASLIIFERLFRRVMPEGYTAVNEVRRLRTSLTDSVDCPLPVSHKRYGSSSRPVCTDDASHYARRETQAGLTDAATLEIGERGRLDAVKPKRHKRGRLDAVTLD